MSEPQIVACSKQFTPELFDCYWAGPGELLVQFADEARAAVRQEAGSRPVTRRLFTLRYEEWVADPDGHPE